MFPPFGQSFVYITTNLNFTFEISQNLTNNYRYKRDWKYKIMDIFIMCNDVKWSYGQKNNFHYSFFIWCGSYNG